MTKLLNITLFSPRVYGRGSKKREKSLDSIYKAMMGHQVKAEKLPVKLDKVGFPI